MAERIIGQIRRINGPVAEVKGVTDATMMELVYLGEARLVGEVIKLAGDAAKGLLLISVKFPVGADLPDTDKTKKQIVALIAKYKAKYGRDPNQFVAQTYDAIQLARLAIEKAKSTDPNKVRAALASISGYDGAGGTFNFARNKHSGLSKSDLVLVKWEDGRFKLADY